MRSRPVLSAAACMLAVGCGRPSPIVAPEATLTVSIGAGAGTVQDPAAGIDCGTDCSARLDVGTEVTLAATPQGTLSFGRWRTGPCAGAADPICSFVLATDTAVEARFGFSLTVVTSGDGVGLVTSSAGAPGIACGTDCVEVYDPGTAVVLSAAPDERSRFAGWVAPGCTGTGTCAVAMDAPVTVLGHFHGRGRALAGWAFGDTNDDTIWGLDVDAGGDVLLCGSYQGTVDFGIGGATASVNRDGFVVRRAPDGTTLWRNVLRDPDVNGSDEVTGCVFDDGGGVVVAGARRSNNDYDFDGDPMTLELTGNATANGAGQDGFVARFVAASGQFDWANSTGGNLATNDNGDRVLGLDSNENDVWIGGDVPGAGQNNGYLMRFSRDTGNATQGAQVDVQTGGTNSQGMEVRAVARDPDSNDVLLTGWYDNQFNWGTEVLTSAAGSQDVVIARANDTVGTPRWAIGFGGNSNADSAEALDYDRDTGLLAVTGRLGDDVFVTVVDDEGSVRAFRRFSGPGGDVGRAVRWLPGGGLLVAGELENGADLGLGPIEVANGTTDAFAAALDANLAPIWVRTFGSTGDDFFRAAAVGPDGSLWVGGEFEDQPDFGGDVGPIPSAGNADAIVLRLLE